MHSKNCLNIGFDIDDVLIQFYKNFIEWYNRKFGTNIKFEDVKSYLLGPVLDLSAEQVDKLVKEFYLSQSHFKIEPVENASKFLNFLMQFSDNLKIILITSRPESIHLQTSDVLRVNFNKVYFSKIHMLGSYDFHKPNPYCKSSVCVDEKIQLMFEDSFDNAVKIAEKGIPVILFNRPWNIECDESIHPLITRTDGFNNEVWKIFHYYRTCYMDGHYFDSLIPYNSHMSQVGG